MIWPGTAAGGLCPAVEGFDWEVGLLVLEMLRDVQMLLRVIKGQMCGDSYNLGTGGVLAEPLGPLAWRRQEVDNLIQSGGQGSGKTRGLIPRVDRIWDGMNIFRFPVQPLPLVSPSPTWFPCPESLLVPAYLAVLGRRLMFLPHMGWGCEGHWRPHFRRHHLAVGRCGLPVL